ncbi:hypothetical protein K2173_012391 [Erythroxylum novogranatense]|uniref:DNA endonuclease activator Ctp1 C-terminal domain-containing protein n=1 Tax=Erythroxylum novogranatense TaxID=1862640 RepID=A0AAV8U9K6_9ROSI|nr:hypothetical protein K2173_012391 [Erythroxylum novogranatense]
MNNTSQNMVQTEDCLIVDEEKLWREEEEDSEKRLFAKVERLEREIKELQQSLRRERETAAEKQGKGRCLVRHLSQVISYLADFEAKLIERVKQNEELVKKLECAEENVHKLQAELKKKNEEIDKEKALQAQLVQEIEENALNLSKQKQQLEESENDRNLLMDRVHDLTKLLNDLQSNPTNNDKVTGVEEDSYAKQLWENQLKSSELLQAEIRQRSDVIEAYKKLKSRYNFLCAKFGITRDNVVEQGQSKDGSLSLNHRQNSTTSNDQEDKELVTAAAACEAEKLKIESVLSNGMVDKVGIKAAIPIGQLAEQGEGLALPGKGLSGKRSIPESELDFPPSGFVARKCHPHLKSAPIIGVKRPASSWIDVRSFQGKGGNDLHDDFLDTPLENFKRNLNKIPKEVVSLDDSDEETQKVNVVHSRENRHAPGLYTVNRVFKYVEGIRNKVEWQSLKGVECKQCKKLYNAVLPKNGGRYCDVNRHNRKHHDGVSGQRHKGIAPMTPEGFWNIGFESEV